MTLHRRRQLAKDLRMPAAVEVVCEALFADAQSKILQSCDLNASQVLIADVDERIGVPRGERFLEQGGRSGVIPACPRDSSVSRKPLAAIQVDVLWIDTQHVPAGGRNDHRRPVAGMFAKRSTKPGDERLDGIGGADRPPRPPQPVLELIGANDVVRM